jgi:hypothetical protein
MPEDYATKANIERVLDRMDSFTIRVERIDHVRMGSIERDEAVETKLLKESRKWAVSFESSSRQGMRW